MPQTNYLSYRRRHKKYSGFLAQKLRRSRACDVSARTIRRRAGRLIMAQERDDLVYLAKLAEQAERFDEMVEPALDSYATRRGVKGGGGRAARPLNGPEPRDRRKSREGSDADGRAGGLAGRRRLSVVSLPLSPSKNLYQFAASGDECSPDGGTTPGV